MKLDDITYGRLRDDFCIKDVPNKVSNFLRITGTFTNRDNWARSGLLDGLKGYSFWDDAEGAYHDISPVAEQIRMAFWLQDLSEDIDIRYGRDVLGHGLNPASNFSRFKNMFLATQRRIRFWRLSIKDSVIYVDYRPYLTVRTFADKWFAHMDDLSCFSSVPCEAEICAAMAEDMRDFISSTTPYETAFRGSIIRFEYVERRRSPQVVRRSCRLDL